MSINKVIKDGKVAVLYSPDYGAGWYTWNTDHPEIIFHPILVALVEQNRQPEIDEELVITLLDKGEVSFYAGGARDLQIEWLEEGTMFKITEYDGAESIETMGDTSWIKA